MSRVKSTHIPSVEGNSITNSMSKKSVRRVLHLCRRSSETLSSEEISLQSEELQSLLDSSNIDLNHPRNKGSLPLCEACRSGNEWAVDILLLSGADVNVRDKNKCTPVYIAASHGHKSILQKLLDRKADVNVKNLQGYLPLLSAVENNHKDTAQMLVDAGADVNILRPNTFGISMTLMTFVLFAKSDIPFAEQLLEAGVCPHSFEKPLNFILLEYGDDCRDFIKKLVYAGFDFYCDGWIKMAQHKIVAELAEVSDNEKDMIKFLEYQYCNPRSLQRLCRTVVRNSLAMSHKKCHIRLKVQQLPLPTEVKKFLLLQYL
ncbi:ankyrin repeat and KH domain-containing protein 1-like [Haliotis rubra]|uniref:ankyrin repeat and KH domain-containing protein 1-like n=1 Tax=Haliotis rubra TaxID=36100 RepID=UPI001EE57746|nr:ankyrin repeat and KH domain-containing protein 1-like [Haliotis rubra]